MILNVHQICHSCNIAVYTLYSHLVSKMRRFLQYKFATLDLLKIMYIVDKLLSSFNLSYLAEQLCNHLFIVEW